MFIKVAYQIICNAHLFTHKGAGQLTLDHGGILWTQILAYLEAAFGERCRYWSEEQGRLCISFVRYLLWGENV